MKNISQYLVILFFVLGPICRVVGCYTVIVVITLNKINKLEIDIKPVRGIGECLRRHACTYERTDGRTGRKQNAHGGAPDWRRWHNNNNNNSYVVA